MANTLLETITNEINQSGGFEVTAITIMNEWPYLYPYTPVKVPLTAYQKRKVRELSLLLKS